MAKAKRILCVIAYDIVNNRRRTKVSRLLEKHGVRINYSVFECMLTEVELKSIQEQIAEWIDTRKDTVVYYRICVNCFTKIDYYPNRREASRIIGII